MFRQNCTVGHTPRAGCALLMVGHAYRGPTMHWFGANSVFVLWGEISADRAFSSSVCLSFLLCHGKSLRVGWNWFQKPSMSKLIAWWSRMQFWTKFNKMQRVRPPFPFCHGMNSKKGSWDASRTPKTPWIDAWWPLTQGTPT